MKRVAEGIRTHFKDFILAHIEKDKADLEDQHSMVYSSQSTEKREDVG